VEYVSAIASSTTDLTEAQPGFLDNFEWCEQQLLSVLVVHFSCASGKTSSENLVIIPTHYQKFGVMKGTGR
jgi:hypothetical protein